MDRFSVPEKEPIDALKADVVEDDLGEQQQQQTSPNRSFA
jgi:hypothetical protein